MLFLKSMIDCVMFSTACYCSLEWPHVRATTKDSQLAENHRISSFLTHFATDSLASQCFWEIPNTILFQKIYPHYFDFLWGPFSHHLCVKFLVMPSLDPLALHGLSFSRDPSHNSATHLSTASRTTR